MNSTSIVIDEDGTAAAYEAPSADVVNEDGEAATALPEGARQNTDGSVTLPLKHPVSLKIKSQHTGQVREQKFEELTFHRLNGADMNAIAAVTGAAVNKVAFQRSLKGVKPAVVVALFDQMDGYDIGRGGEVLEAFLGTRRRTGR